MTSYVTQSRFDSKRWITDYAGRATAPGVEVAHYLDFDQQAEQLVGFDQEYHQLSAGRFEGRFVSVDFGAGTSIHVEYASQALAQSMCAPADHISLGFVLGRAPYVVNGQPLEQSYVLLIPPGAELHFRSPQSGSIIAVCISLDTMFQATGADGLPFLASGQSARVLEAPDFSARARNDILDTLNAVSVHGDVAHLGRVLATSLLANLTAEIALRSGGTVKRNQSRKLDNFLRATAIFKSYGHAPLTYDTLTALTGASRRNLQNSFKDVVGCGPFEYFRLLRLSQARSRIAMQSTGTQTIGDIAAASGFYDWSNFSRLYKHQFGESPSKTRQRLCEKVHFS